MIKKILIIGICIVLFISIVEHIIKKNVISDPTVSVNEVLKVGESVFPLTLNPFNITRDVEYRISSLIYEPLIKFDWNGKVKTVLAKTCEDISIDRNDWAIAINNTIKWSDNTPFTVKDVKYTLERIQCSKHAHATLFQDATLSIEEKTSNEIIIRFPSTILKTFENIKYFKIPVLKSNTLGRCGISDRHFSKNKNFFSTNHKNLVIGTGAYIFDQYNDTTHKVIFKVNQHYRYYQPDNSFKIIEFLILTHDYKLAKDGFEKERIKDTPYLDINPTVPFSFLIKEPENVRVFPNISNDVYLLGFNYLPDNDKDPRNLFGIKEFRKALILAIKIIDIMQKGELSKYSNYLKLRYAPLGEDDSIAEVRSKELYKFNDIEAKEWLHYLASQNKDVNYDNGLKFKGKEVEFSLVYRKWTPDSEKVVTQIVKHLENNLGLSIKTHGVSYKINWSETIKNRHFDMIFTAIHIGRNKNFFPYFSKNNDLNIFGYNDPFFQQYVENYKYSSPIMKSTALVDANNYLSKDIAAIFLWKRNYVGVVRKDVETGPDNRLDSRNLFENISSWKIRDDKTKEPKNE